MHSLPSHRQCEFSRGQITLTWDSLHPAPLGSSFACETLFVVDTCSWNCTASYRQSGRRVLQTSTPRLEREKGESGRAGEEEIAGERREKEREMRLRFVPSTGMTKNRILPVTGLSYKCPISLSPPCERESQRGGCEVTVSRSDLPSHTCTLVHAA
jgi:hypothetical protein